MSLWNLLGLILLAGAIFWIIGWAQAEEDNYQNDKDDR